MVLLCYLGFPLKQSGTPTLLHTGRAHRPPRSYRPSGFSPVLIEGQPADPSIQAGAEPGNRLNGKSRHGIQFGPRELEPGGDAGRRLIPEEPNPEGFVRHQLPEEPLYCCLTHWLSLITLRRCYAGRGMQGRSHLPAAP